MRLMRKISLWLVRRMHVVSRRIDWWKQDIVVAHGTTVRGKVEIGAHTRINRPSFLTACRIGRHCAIAGPLTVRSSNHNLHAVALQAHTQRDLVKSKKANYGFVRSGVLVGHNVWIGDSVILLDGADIGHSSIVAAGSVVNRAFPPFSIIGGVPARLIEMRFSEEKMEILSKIDWWTWDTKRLRANQFFFELDLDKISVDELWKRIEQIVP